MKTKNLSIMLLAVATALATPEVVTVITNDVATQSAEFSGPTECEVGEMVVLHWPAQRVTWDVPVVDYHTDGTRLYVSFRKSGTYTITAAAVIGTRVELVKHTIVVGTPEPPAPDVDDDTPAPKPPTNLTDDVYEWCESIEPNKVNCERLANNFIKAASEASDLDDLMKMTASLNRNTPQEGCEAILGKIQQHLFDSFQGKDFEHHRCAWDEIAMGLIKWAEQG
jgi:hypothetical protein